MKTSTLVKILKGICYPVKFISNLFVKMQFVIYGAISAYASFKVAEIGTKLSDTQVGLGFWCGAVSFMLLIGAVAMIGAGFINLYEKQRRNNY